MEASMIFMMPTTTKAKYLRSPPAPVEVSLRLLFLPISSSGSPSQNQLTVPRFIIRAMTSPGLRYFFLLPAQPAYRFCCISTFISHVLTATTQEIFSYGRTITKPNQETPRNIDIRIQITQSNETKVSLVVVLFLIHR
jgi:hypothetical protein